MKVTVEINNLTKSPISEAVFKNIAKKTLNRADFKFLKNKDIYISLAFVGREEIKKINRTYRKKNEPTDVLSFAEYKNIREIMRIKGKKIFLGELILCYDDVKEYARKRGLVFKKELAIVFVHGLLHLLGFRHGKKMSGIQNTAAGDIKKI